MTLDQIAKPIYDAIKSWQDGVMTDLPEWEEAGADCAVVELARYVAEGILRDAEDEIADARQEAYGDGYECAVENYAYDD